MNTNFIVDDYCLIWCLLFGPSVSEKIYELKKKIWVTYKNEYNQIFNDKQQFLKDYKNFIPNNDMVYNILLEDEGYEKLKKETEKYRLEIMTLWDKNKKLTATLYDHIIKLEVPKHNFFVVYKDLNIIEHPTNNSLIIGQKINEKDNLDILVKINQIIIDDVVKKYKDDCNDFKKAILEFAVLNEYKTKLENKNYYSYGEPSLKKLKNWLYPYWLMYLGIPKEEFSKRMQEDGYYFDKDKYAYEKELKKMNIEEFIDFCIRNKKYIVREGKEKRIEVL